MLCNSVQFSTPFLHGSETTQGLGEYLQHIIAETVTWNQHKRYQKKTCKNQSQVILFNCMNVWLQAEVERLKKMENVCCNSPCYTGGPHRTTWLCADKIWLLDLSHFDAVPVIRKRICIKWIFFHSCLCVFHSPLLAILSQNALSWI